MSACRLVAQSFALGAPLGAGALFGSGARSQQLTARRLQRGVVLVAHTRQLLVGVLFETSERLDLLVAGSQLAHPLVAVVQLGAQSGAVGVGAAQLRFELVDVLVQLGDQFLLDKTRKAENQNKLI